MIRSYIKYELEWVEYPYKGGSMAQESTLFARYLFDFVNYVTCGNYTIDEKTRYLLNGDDMISKTYYDVGVVDYLNGTDYSVTDRLLVAEALKNTTCMPLEHLTPFYLEPVGDEDTDGTFEGARFFKVFFFNGAHVTLQMRCARARAAT